MRNTRVRAIEAETGYRDRKERRKYMRERRWRSQQPKFKRSARSVRVEEYNKETEIIRKKMHEEFKKRPMHPAIQAEIEKKVQKRLGRKFRRV